MADDAVQPGFDRSPDRDARGASSLESRSGCADGAKECGDGQHPQGRTVGQKRSHNGNECWPGNGGDVVGQGVVGKGPPLVRHLVRREAGEPSHIEGRERPGDGQEGENQRQGNLAKEGRCGEGGGRQEARGRYQDARASGAVQGGTHYGCGNHARAQGDSH